MPPIVALNSVHAPSQSTTVCPKTSLVAGSCTTFCIIGCCKMTISKETMLGPFFAQRPISNISRLASPSLQYATKRRLRNWSPAMTFGLISGARRPADGYTKCAKGACFGLGGMKMGAFSDTPSRTAATRGGSWIRVAARYADVPGWGGPLCGNSFVPKAFSMHSALQTNLTKSRPLEKRTLPGVVAKNSRTIATFSSAGPAMLLTSSRV
mmetsp:Transcript_101288/g.253940  ORF Transcript_101288/g.253940 Transcript_101288/m.253940 type:complete len:210 (-) Transcript_101288:338-967(-)